MVEELIKKHGEEYRRLIVGALKFYEEHAKEWGERFNCEEYIGDLVQRCIL